MASCPVCTGPMEQLDRVFFCPACRSSIQPLDALASALGVAPGRPELEPELEHGMEPIGRCPACAGGQLRPARMRGEPVGWCDACGARWVSAAQVARLRSVMMQPTRRPEPEDGRSYAARFAQAGRFPYNTRAANLYAFPGALALGVVAHVTGFSILVWATVQMWFHELGHAVIAWLGGFIAVPLPFFTTMPREERSVAVIAIVVGMILAIAYESAKRRLWAMVIFAGALALAQALLTFVLTPGQAMKWCIFAGQGGAIVLPTLVMLAFYQPLGWRWDFWRYPAAALGAIGFVQAMFIWVGVARGTAVMPHGSAVGQESEGDMERLVRTYGWTQESLAHAYLLLGVACLVALAAAYAVYLRRIRIQEVAQVQA